MNEMEYDISAGALLVFALAYFFDTTGAFSALVPAIVIHELGHILFLKIGGAKIKKLKLGLFGLELDYYGIIGKKSALMSVIAGPGLGIIYAALGLVTASRFVKFSCVFSLLLSIINLLPVMPMDGGRIINLLFGGAVARKVSLGISVLIFAVGITVLFKGFGIGILFTAVWLITYNTAV